MHPPMPSLPAPGAVLVFQCGHKDGTLMSHSIVSALSKLLRARRGSGVRHPATIRCAATTSAGWLTDSLQPVADK